MLFSPAFAVMIDRYPLLSYIALSFLVSWGAVLVISGVEGLPVMPDQAMTAGMALLLGPAVAGVLLTALDTGREGLSSLLVRLCRWRARMRWYAFALLLAPVSTTLLLLCLSWFSPEFTPRQVPVDELVPRVMSGLLAGIVIGTMEELGWTGFAVQHMRQSRTVVATGLVIGLAWGSWHLIVFWEQNSFSDVMAFSILLARLFAWLPQFRILMVFLYQRTDSLLLVILMHASLVASVMLVEPVLSGANLLVLILAKGLVLLLILFMVRLRVPLRN